jgi:ABC-2 type transport system permease protein
VNWIKVRAIVEKEIADARKNRMIIISMALLPIMLVTLTLGSAYFFLNSGDELEGDDAGIIPPQLEYLDAKNAFLIMLNDQYMFYILLIPMVIPVYIAAYSIVGEKETKSLEPLLATPISVWELLVGKSFAATVPAVILTWLSFLVLVIGGYIIMPQPVFEALVRPVWLVGMLLLSPLLALLSVFSGMIASSRLNDPRAAQQVTGIFVVPIIALSIVVLMGRIFLSVEMVLLAAFVTLVVDVIVLYFAVKLFQRETILTRWK